MKCGGENVMRNILCSISFSSTFHVIHCGNFYCFSTSVLSARFFSHKSLHLSKDLFNPEQCHQKITLKKGKHALSISPISGESARSVYTSNQIGLESDVSGSHIRGNMSWGLVIFILLRCCLFLLVMQC